MIRHDAPDGSRYYIHPVTDERLPSVTTIISATDGKSFLVPWSAKGAAIYAVRHLDKVTELKRDKGEDEAVELITRESKRFREVKADTGTYVHEIVHALTVWGAEGPGADIALPTLPEHLVGARYDGAPLDEVVDWMVEGFVNFVSEFDPFFEAAEMITFNLGLKYAGTADSIPHLRGVALKPNGFLTPSKNALRLLVDVKTGRTLDGTVPEQIAGYRRSTEALPLQGDLVPMPPTDAGAVLHLRPEWPRGYRLMPIAPADDAAGWNRFRRAIDLYRGRAEANGKPGRVVRPLRKDGTVPPPWLADLIGDGYGKVIGPLTTHGLKDVSEVAALTSKQVLAVHGIGKKTLDTVRQMLADHDMTLADEHKEAVA